MTNTSPSLQSKFLSSNTIIINEFMHFRETCGVSASSSPLPKYWAFIHGSCHDGEKSRKYDRQGTIPLQLDKPGRGYQ